MTDILIRGMEMPTDSPVYLTVCPSGGVYVHTYERGYGALVKSQYRVVELPEHGDLISREEALSMPFANGKYDHENADEHFIYGCETYKEWLEQLPIVISSNKEDTK